MSPCPSTLAGLSDSADCCCCGGLDGPSPCSGSSGMGSCVDDPLDILDFALLGGRRLPFLSLATDFFGLARGVSPRFFKMPGTAVFVLVIKPFLLLEEEESWAL